MKKKIKSTYEEFVQSLTSDQKKEFDAEYQDLLLSEMILAAMQQDDISVRKLAKLAGVSPTIVQELRSGTKKNITIQVLFKVLRGLGCNLVIERKGHYVPLNISEIDSDHTSSARK